MSRPSVSAVQAPVQAAENVPLMTSVVLEELMVATRLVYVGRSERVPDREAKVLNELPTVLALADWHLELAVI